MTPGQRKTPGHEQRKLRIAIERAKANADKIRTESSQKLNYDWRNYRRQERSPEEWSAYRMRVAKRLWLSLMTTQSVMNCIAGVEFEIGRGLTSAENIAEIKKLLAEGELGLTLSGDDDTPESIQ